MRQDRFDNHKDEYKELCEIFGVTPKIDVDKLYDCEVRLEGEIEKLINSQNKKLYKQAKAELEIEGVQYNLSTEKKMFILNQFKNFLFDFRIFPQVKDYKAALKCDKRSQIIRVREKVEEGWSYDL